MLSSPESDLSAEPLELEPPVEEPLVEGLSLEELSLPPLPAEETADGVAELPASAVSSLSQAVVVAARAVTAAAARTRRAERVARRERIMISSGCRLRCFC